MIKFLLYIFSHVNVRALKAHGIPVGVVMKIRIEKFDETCL